MTSLSLWLKWSLRDLKQRWLQVVVIAMIIALGTGAYVGLGSNTPWRTQSLDESYVMLNMYDFKMELAPGSAIDSSELVRVVNATEGVQDSEMRLILPSFVDATTLDRTIMVSGRIIGVDVSTGWSKVNDIHITAGRAMGASDSGEPVCIVEYNFAAYHDLEPDDREIQIRGGHSLNPVGIGMSPEYFVVMTEEGGMMAQADFAALFLPLETVQEMADLPGMVNDLLITIADGVDVETVRLSLQEAMAEAFPEVGVTFEEKSENKVYSLMYEDVSNDQAMFNIFAYLLLAGAALGTFTLVSRMVESQRREIGIHMALGVEPSIITRRYLFAGAQISLLGVLFGLVAGAILSQAFGNLLREWLPMPYFRTPFQVQVFIRGALLGVAIPLLAAIYPIWRAVRVTPIEAIQTGHLVAKSGGLAPSLARLPLPGSSLTKFPFRNLSRNPRRTLLTILGITMAVIILVLTMGMLDAFLATLDAGQEEHLKGAPDRMLVSLEDFYPIALLPLSDESTDSMISKVEPVITLPGSISSQDGETFDVIVQMMDLGNNLWTPTILRGNIRAEEPGVIISEKAARDLGVDLGDIVKLKHPYRETMFAYRLEVSEVKVIGIHADVLRFYLYMDIEDAAMMNLGESVNSLQIVPTAGIEEDEIRKELSQIRGVASVQSVSALVDIYAELLDLFIDTFAIGRYVAILLAFLIAFNTTSINVDERRRELATMFAFGARVQTAIRISIIENLAIGILSTIFGVCMGWAALHWILYMRMETMLPEIGILIHAAPSTMIFVAFFGVLVVALTPVFAIRKITQMDIPSTLRVIE